MIHLIGIKGTGMASLACILADLDYNVQGSDLSRHFFTEEPLIERGIEIFEFDPLNIKDDMTVIIGNAFHDGFPEVKAALDNSKVKCYRYHNFLGELMQNYQSISVAGSHGKTTTTTMLSTMLNEDSPCGYLIGDGTGALSKESLRFVVESCEFRRHFLSYFPDYAIITNAELDHVDYFKSVEDYHYAYEEFALNIKNKIALYGDDAETKALNIASEKAIYYGEEDFNDVQALSIKQSSSRIEFDVLVYKEPFGSFNLPLVGKHMLANALACITIGYLLGLSAKTMQDGLSKFKGAKRRFVIEEIGDNVFIDDYAHHSTEVNMTIQAAKTRYPDKKIVAVFKPHRASRLVRFLDAYINALRQADFSGVCEFTSIDDFDDGTEVSVSYLTEKVPGCKVFNETDEDADYLASLNPAVYLFMSSKDIYDFASAVKMRVINNTDK